MDSVCPDVLDTVFSFLSCADKSRASVTCVTWRDTVSTYPSGHGIKKCGSCDEAARNGHLACLKELRERKHPQSINTTRCAIESGSVDCLQYLIGSGCPYDPPLNQYMSDSACKRTAIDYAAKNGHFKVRRTKLSMVKYLTQKGHL